jgi:hypothetical protein
MGACIHIWIKDFNTQKLKARGTARVGSLPDAAAVNKTLAERV